MYEKTLTEILIERGIIKPLPSSFILDGDESNTFILDGESQPQNEKKSQT